MTDQAPQGDDIEDLESAIARAEADAAALKARRDAAIAAERPNALATVLALVAKHGITRDELDPALRKRTYAPRPRSRAKLLVLSPEPQKVAA